MSATLTRRRGNRLEIDRASDIKWGIGGEKEGAVASTEVLVVRKSRNWVRFTSREGSTGPSCLACPARSFTASCRSCTCRRRPRSPCRRRRLHALDQPRCCSCPRRRRPASLCCSLSLCCSSLSCTSTSAAARSLAHVLASHLCSARTRMREIIWCVAGCGAQSGALAVDALAAHGPCCRRRLHALDQPRCCSCPRRRRPASLCCSPSLCSSSLSCTSTSAAASLAHVLASHLCSARTRMREINR
jgi:hypothetical protein